MPYIIYNHPHASEFLFLINVHQRHNLLTIFTSPFCVYLVRSPRTLFNRNVRGGEKKGGETTADATVPGDDIAEKEIKKSKGRERVQKIKPEQRYRSTIIP